MARLPEMLDPLVNKGRFGDALALLLARRACRVDDPVLFDAYEAELSYETGRERKAAILAEESLERQPVPAVSARLNRVLALCAFNRGEMTPASAHLSKARVLSGPRGRFAAVLDLVRLAFDIQLEPLVNVLASMRHVRQSVAAAGDPHVLALLRIYVARCEARTNGLAEARRHHRIVSDLLEGYPNFWLQGLVEIDRSVVELLTGDTDRALRSAERALDCSRE